jgi:hypothetical protein
MLALYQLAQRKSILQVPNSIMLQDVHRVEDVWANVLFCAAYNDLQRIIFWHYYKLVVNLPIGEIHKLCIRFVVGVPDSYQYSYLFQTSHDLQS